MYRVFFFLIDGTQRPLQIELSAAKTPNFVLGLLMIWEKGIREKKKLVPKVTDRGKFGALYCKTGKMCIKHGEKLQNAKPRLRSRHQRQYFEL